MTFRPIISKSISKKLLFKVTYVWKINLSRPWTFDNDLCRLRVISHLYWRSNSRVFINVWLSLDKSIGEFPTVYKKWVLWFRKFLSIFKFCLVYSGSASHFLFHVHVLCYANLLRNGMKCACASADYVPLRDTNGKLAIPPFCTSSMKKVPPFLVPFFGITFVLSLTRKLYWSLQGWLQSVLLKIYQHWPSCKAG